jgi:hypothetical protein
MEWSEIKKEGNPAYKTGNVEPIDLYKADGTLHDWVLNEISHHARRNIKALRTIGTEKYFSDMRKIIHYAEIMICLGAEDVAKQSNKVPSGVTDAEMM